MMAGLLLITVMAANAQTDSTSRNQNQRYNKVPRNSNKTNRNTGTNNSAGQTNSTNQGQQVTGNQGNQSGWNQQESYRNDSTWVSTNRTPEERADMSSTRLQRQLGLTDDQTTKIREINLTKARKADELRTKYKSQTQANRTDREPDFKALMDETDAEYKSVLDATQYANWQQMEMKMKNRKMEKMERKEERKDNKMMDKTPNNQ